MRKFYKAAERLMWCSVFLAIAVFPLLAANYSMI